MCEWAAVVLVSLLDPSVASFLIHIHIEYTADGPKRCSDAKDEL